MSIVPNLIYSSGIKDCSVINLFVLELFIVATIIDQYNEGQNQIVIQRKGRKRGNYYRMLFKSNSSLRQAIYKESKSDSPIV